MSLHVLAYNLKRLMRILGIGAMLAAIRAWGARALIRVQFRPFPPSRPSTWLNAHRDAPSASPALLRHHGASRSSRCELPAVFARPRPTAAVKVPLDGASALHDRRRQTYIEMDPSLNSVLSSHTLTSTGLPDAEIRLASASPASTSESRRISIPCAPKPFATSW